MIITIDKMRQEAWSCLNSLSGGAQTVGLI